MGIEQELEEIEEIEEDLGDYDLPQYYPEWEEDLEENVVEWD